MARLGLILLLLSLLPILFFTIPTGAQKDPLSLQWSETWDFAGIIDPVDITIDHNDSIYVSANVLDEQNNNNIMLIKYHENKTLAWAKEFDNGDSEVASDTVVRGNAIYIVGRASNLLLLLKYTSDGELVYAKYANITANGIPSLDVNARHVYIVVGNWLFKYHKMSGQISDAYELGDRKLTFANVQVYGASIYVTGHPEDSFKIIIQKRDLDGNIILNMIREESVEEGATDIYLYRSMFYITGIRGSSMEVKGLQATADLMILKYDEKGNRIWERKWGSDSAMDVGLEIKMHRNEVYVMGITSSYDGNISNTLLQRYSVDGEIRWSISSGIGIGIDISFDAKGDSIYLLEAQSDNFIVKQYNS